MDLKTIAYTRIVRYNTEHVKRIIASILLQKQDFPLNWLVILLYWLLRGWIFHLLDDFRLEESISSDDNLAPI